MASGLNRVSIFEVPEVKALEDFDERHREELDRLREVQGERDIQGIVNPDVDKAVHKVVARYKVSK